MRGLATSVQQNRTLPITLYGSIRVGDGRRIAVTVTEISSDRCKLDTPEMLPVGAVVWLDVPGRKPISASVHWSVIGKSGLRFL
jgi:hypothetical protein